MKILIVRNKKSGGNAFAFFEYVRELDKFDHDITLRSISKNNTLKETLDDVDNFDRLVVAGGDGTVSAITSALKGKEISVMIYPGGTANIMAVNLGLPNDPKRLASLTIEGSVVQTDLVEIIYEYEEALQSKKTFIMNAGAGFDADIVKGSEELKPTLGAAAYIVSALQVKKPTYSQIRLDIDGEIVETSGIAVLLINFSKTLFDLSIVSDSEGHDGIVEAVVIKPKSLVGMAPIALQILTESVRSGKTKHLEVYKGKKIRVTADPPLPIQYDGELLNKFTPFEVSVLPRAINLIVPHSYSKKK